MRTIPDPGFAGDTGEVDAGLAVALQAYDETPDDEDARRAVLARLQDVRLLVPVVALLGDVEVDDQGLAHDKTSDMAAVLMTGRDGRTGPARLHRDLRAPGVGPHGASGSRDHEARRPGCAPGPGVRAAHRRRRPGDVRGRGRGPPRPFAGTRCALNSPSLVPLCVTDRSCPRGQDRSDKRRPPPTRIDRSHIRSSGQGHGMRDRCRRTPVTEASVRRTEAFLHVRAEMR